MSNLQLFSNELFPAWMDFDRFDNYIYENGKQYIDPAKNKYRWEENEEAYKLDVVMPGLTKKDIDLTFKDNVLSLKCNKKVSEKDQSFYGVKTEQYFKNFPKGINADKISAEMEEGILKIVLPKETCEKAKNIYIK
jgi:HSP20 family protein|tara:strand:+ start:836 stop:1243 length:408 start_codon:yes stop_codon:yes gene_type:complete